MRYHLGDYDIQCEWGEAGIEVLAGRSDAVIIVDVFSFGTCVEVAVSRGALVYPYGWKDVRAVEFASSLGAILAGPRSTHEGYNLSPVSLLGIPAGTRLVLPSPNGATLSLATGGTPTFAGCLRNAGAVAREALKIGSRVAVIPAGERWADGTVRFAAEDLLGAGAIISNLPGSRSPEARLAEAAFESARPDLASFMRDTISGRELIERGFSGDVEVASSLDAGGAAPRLTKGGYYGMDRSAPQ